jgi:hypothetical protein
MTHTASMASGAELFTEKSEPSTAMSESVTAMSEPATAMSEPVTAMSEPVTETALTPRVQQVADLIAEARARRIRSEATAPGPRT